MREPTINRLRSLIGSAALIDLDRSNRKDGLKHDFDCRIYRGPAYPLLSCDCGAAFKAERRWLVYLACRADIYAWRLQRRARRLIAKLFRQRDRCPTHPQSHHPVELRDPTPEVRDPPVNRVHSGGGLKRSSWDAQQIRIVASTLHGICAQSSQ